MVKICVSGFTLYNIKIGALQLFHIKTSKFSGHIQTALFQFYNDNLSYSEGAERETTKAAIKGVDSTVD